MFDAFEIVLLLLLGDSMDLFWCLSFLHSVVRVKVNDCHTLLHLLKTKQNKTLYLLHTHLTHMLQRLKFYFKSQF